jgi:hypothetical protein
MEKCLNCRRALVSRYFFADLKNLVLVCAKCDSVSLWPEKK